jgi:hypothetical protein
LHHELLADEDTGRLIPRLKLSESDLERAKTHLANGDLRASAVYARAAFEWKLRNVCDDRGIEIKFKKENKLISVDDLWQGIVARQRKREDLQKTKAGAPDFLPNQLERDVETMRSTILNQLSHAGAPGLVASDVQFALKTLEALHKHAFPKA